MTAERRSLSQNAARARRASALVAAVVALGLVTLTGCSTRQLAVPTPTARGGTLHVLVDHQVGTWDPQRIDQRADAVFAGRTFLRTLTAPAPAESGFLPGLLGDLATSTGTERDDGRLWSFTLVTNAPWQDGRFVTCADVKYGVSRGFARDRVAGGPTNAVDVLEVPTYNDPQGHTVSAYEGPYSGKGQAFFDRAVTCDGQVITFRLNQSRYDFAQIVSTAAFAPVRQDQDTARTTTLSVFSSGPYMLEGVWKPGEGGRFVRNRRWLSLEDPVRLAWPDVIEVEEAVATTTLVQRLVDDRGDDRNAITWADAPAAMSPQLTLPALASRVTRPDSGVVDVLVRSSDSTVMADPAVRAAFSLATDRDGYAAATGSPMTAVTSALAQNIPGRPEEPGAGPGAGDVDAARSALATAGVSGPVPVRVAYPAGEAFDRGLAALTRGWTRAGFAVALVPREPGKAPPTTAADVTLVSESAAWPSGGAVLPALLARIGDPTLTAAAAQAAAQPRTTDRDAAWGALDATLVAAGDLVPLAERQRLLVRGSGVLGYQENALLGGLPDLAAIEVTHDDPG